MRAGSLGCWVGRLIALAAMLAIVVGAAGVAGAAVISGRIGFDRIAQLSTAYEWDVSPVDSGAGGTHP